MTDTLCQTCGSTGLVCPTCNGARYVIHTEREIGSATRVVVCRDCCNVVSTPNGDTRVLLDDQEQRMIALWLQAHRETHPAIANPSRVLEPDPAWHDWQLERERETLAKRRADAAASYAEYVAQWGDPKAATERTKKKRAANGSAKRSSISDAQIAEMTAAIIEQHAKGRATSRARDWGVLE